MIAAAQPSGRHLLAVCRLASGTVAMDFPSRIGSKSQLLAGRVSPWVTAPFAW